MIKICVFGLYNSLRSCFSDQAVHHPRWDPNHIQFDVNPPPMEFAKIKVFVRTANSARRLGGSSRSRLPACGKVRAIRELWLRSVWKKRKTKKCHAVSDSSTCNCNNFTPPQVISSGIGTLMLARCGLDKVLLSYSEDRFEMKGFLYVAVAVVGGNRRSNVSSTEQKWSHSGWLPYTSSSEKVQMQNEGLWRSTVPPQSTKSSPIASCHVDNELFNRGHEKGEQIRKS